MISARTQSKRRPADNVNFSRLCWGGPLLALSAAASIAASSALGQPADRTSPGGMFLRYLNAPEAGRELRQPPNLWLSFGGSRAPAMMDTGSTGVVVPATLIPNVDQLPRRGPGTMPYASGRILRGDWVLVPVTIAGANGISLTTKPIPVLAVRSADCVENAPGCTPGLEVSHPVIGVGFGRKGRAGNDSGPSKNPFLNGSEMDAGHNGVRRGYLVTREGVQVGLTGPDSPAGYATVRLRHDDEHEDWTAAPACVSVNGHTPSACGTVLPDTGSTVMFLTVPPDQQQGIVLTGAPRPDRQIVGPGTKVAISLAPDAQGLGAASDYSFTVGDMADPMAPSRVILLERGDQPTFVNTSLRVLNGFDYLFDAENGIIGYRWTGRVPAGSS
ncbi:MAG: hypothetical protein JO230_27195, partial [Xanthobacteraceae bacterium]|nr:hypothetical protein [Xanthobacteraceae bacterium]